MEAHIGTPAYETLLNQFAEDGMLSPEGFWILHDLQPVIDEYGALADRLAVDYLRAGVITEDEPGDSTEGRLLQLMRQTNGTCFQAMDITLPVEDRIRVRTLRCT